MKFSYHVNQLSMKAIQKLYAIARVSSYMDKVKVKLIMSSFIMSHFNYFPLIWMFYGIATNNRINQIHERALRIVYRDSECAFEELLAIDNSVSIHQGILQLLMIEIYKTRKKLNPSFMEDFFVEKTNPYNLRNNNGLIVPRANIIAHGIETIMLHTLHCWLVLFWKLRMYDFVVM